MLQTRPTVGKFEIAEHKRWLDGTLETTRQDGAKGSGDRFERRGLVCGTNPLGTAPPKYPKALTIGAAKSTHVESLLGVALR